MSQKKAYGAFTIVCIVSLSFNAGFAATIPAPILGSLALIFPEVPISTISMTVTLGSVMMMLFALLAGALVGRKIGFRPAAIIGLCAVIVGGVIPFFTDTSSFPVILASRVIATAGIGFTQPLVPALAFRLFEGAKAHRIIGFHSGCMTLGAAVASLASGWVGSVSLNLVWLLNLVVIAILVLVIVGLPEPEKIPSKAQAAASGEAKLPALVKVPVAALVSVFVIYFFVVLANGNISLNISYMVMEVAPDGPAAGLAGTASFLLMGFAFLGGMVYGTIYKACGRFVAVIGGVLGAAGLLLVYFCGSNFVVFVIGAVVGNLGYVLFSSYVMGLIGMLTPARDQTTVMSFASALGSLSMFVIPYACVLAQTIMGVGGLFVPTCLFFAPWWIILLVIVFFWNYEGRSVKKFQEAVAAAENEQAAS